MRSLFNQRTWSVIAKEFSSMWTSLLEAEPFIVCDLISSCYHHNGAKTSQFLFILFFIFISY